VLTLFTGDPFFTGGIGTFTTPQNTLDIELGPTQDVELQWARYYDAADQAGIARLLSGIHIRADDFGGRTAGSAIGVAAYQKARSYFVPEPAQALVGLAAAVALALLSRRRSSPHF
jgi:MYXO-CTERM domain-containing protein